MVTLRVLHGGHRTSSGRPRLIVLPRLLPTEVAERCALERYLDCFAAWKAHRERCFGCQVWSDGLERDPCGLGGELWSAEVLAERDCYRAIDRANVARRRRVARARGGGDNAA